MVMPLSALSPLIQRARSITFSQYGEDLMLYGLRPRARGFYVDVGAYHPWQDSNTYKLYLRGWSGLTIEPNPDTAAAFARTRPRDTHLTMGIARQPAELLYHRFQEEKFNTFEPDEYRATLPRRGEPIVVPVRPLADVLSEHAGEKHIDLLSVDCEGFDLQVLESVDWSRTKPTAVLVEDFDGFRAARDNGQQSAIASLLRSHGYCSVGQATFSFLFVERDALSRPAEDSGFDLTRSQLMA